MANKNTKPNDMFLNLIDNPTFTLTDFESVGLTPENTSLESIDVYKNSQFILDKFKTPEGTFDETTFNSYYDTALKAYNAFAKGDFEKKYMEELSYDFHNVYAPEKSKITPLTFSIVKIANPDRQQIGVGSIYGISDPVKSAAEIAQSQKVWDYEANKWLDWTPEDRGVLKFWTLPTIVMATWEEDGTHKDPISGRNVKHQKGERKLNNEGTYYYETIGNRQIYGKEVASYFDTLTKEDSWINKYDFFDSDDLEKSIPGTIMKTVATIAPLFIPIVGEVYLAAGISKELSKLLPVLYKSSFGLLADDNSSLNKLESFAYSLDGSVSEYSKQNMLTAENVFNLVADVALQLQQQRWIFQRAPGLIKAVTGQGKVESNYLNNLIKTVNKSKSPLNPEQLNTLISSEMAVRATNLQKNLQNYSKTLSQIYMAGISGMDSYGAAIEAGYSNGEAAIISWATLAGMYGIQSTQFVENYMFPELADERAMFRAASRAVADDVRGGIQKIAKEKIPEQIKKYKMFEFVKKAATKYATKLNTGTLGIPGAAFTEGVEEVTEEVWSDFVKWTSDTFATDDNKRFDIFEDQFLARYGMAFFGGALGGGMNKVITNVTMGKKSTEQDKQELIYLIRNNKGKEVKDFLTNEWKKGRLGSTVLSATDYTKDGSEMYFKEAQSAEDSQNTAVYRMSMDYVNYLESILNQENLNLTDQAILDSAVLKEVRYQELMKSGYAGKILQDFNTLASKIYSAQMDIDAMSDLSDEGKVQARQDPEYQQKLANAQGKLNELRVRYNDFLTGANSEHYLKMTLFGLNRLLYEPTNILTFRSYAEYYSKKNYEDLSQSEIKELQDNYETYTNYQKSDQLEIGFSVFDNFNKKYSPRILELANSPQYQESLKALTALSKLKTSKMDSQFYGTDITDNDAFKENARELHKIAKEFGIPAATIELLSQGYVDTIEAGRVSQFLDDALIVGQKLSQDGVMDNEYYTLLAPYINAFDFIRNTPLTNFRNLDDTYYFQVSQLDTQLDSQLEDLLDVKLRYTNIPETSNRISELVNASNKITPEAKTYTINALNNMLQSYLINPISDIEGSPTGQEILPKLEQIKNLKLRPVSNPLAKLVDEIALNLTGKRFSIFNLIEEEKQRLSNVGRADDFVIDSKSRLEDLEQAKQVLGLIKSIIYASQSTELDGLNPFGYNQSINNFRDKHNLKGEPLGVLNSDASEAFLNYIESIDVRLDYLNRLASLNKANQLTEHKKTAINIRTLLFKIFSGDSNKWLQNTPIFKGIADLVEKSPTLMSLRENINQPISDELYINTEKEITALEDLVYSNFKQMNVTNIQQTLYDMFIVDPENGFDTNNFNSVSEFNSTETSFENSDLYIYLHSLMAFKSSDFNYYLKELLASDQFEYAPVFSQEFAARIAVSQIVNPDLFVAALNNIQNDEVPKLFNIIFVDGITGAGKTSATGKLVSLIANQLLNNPNIWASGPYDQQRDNLGKILNLENNLFNKTELFNKILGERVYQQLVDDLKNDSTQLLTLVDFQHEGNTLKKPVLSNIDALEFNRVNLPKIIYIDEITHFNSFELEILSKFATDNNIQIVAFGDTEQNGILGKYKNVRYGNIDATRKNQTPKLSISMRATNIQNLDNLNSVRAINSKFQSSFEDYRNSGNQQNLDYIKENLVLKFYEDGNVLAGDKIIESLTEATLKKLTSEDEQMLFIYEDSESDAYKLIDLYDPEQKYFKRILINDVQGSESKYAIIDINWNKYNDTDIYAPLNLIKNLYTSITRAEDGAILINNGLTEFLKDGDGYLGKINLIEDVSTNSTTFNQEGLDNFKEFRLGVLNSNLANYTPEVLTIEENTITPLKEVVQPIINNETTDITENTQEELNEVQEEKKETISENEIDTPVVPERPIEGSFTSDNTPTDTDIFSPTNLTPIENPDGSVITAAEGLLAYGFYNRFATLDVGDSNILAYNPNESNSELNMFLKENERVYRNTKEGQQLIDSYFKLKSAILYSNSSDQINDKINNLFKKRFRSDLRDIDWGDGGFEVRYKKFEPEIDTTDLNLKFGFNEEAAQQETGYIASIVYVVRDTNSDILGEITMFALPKSETISRAIQSITNVEGKKSKQELLNKYNNLLDNLTLEYNKTGFPVYRAINPAWRAPISSLRLVKTNNVGNGETNYNLSEIVNNNPGMTFSDPFILTGKDSEFSSLLKDSNNKVKSGRAIIFATADKYMKNIQGDIVEPNELSDLYRNSFTSPNERSNKKVTMFYINPKGVTFKEYMNMYDKEISKARDNRDKDGMPFSKNLSGRMFAAMWNFRADILNRSTQSQSDKLSLELINNIFKDLEAVIPRLKVTKYKQSSYFSPNETKNPAMTKVLKALQELDVIYQGNEEIKLPKGLEFNETYTLMKAFETIFSKQFGDRTIRDTRGNEIPSAITNSTIPQHLNIMNKVINDSTLFPNGIEYMAIYAKKGYKGNATKFAYPASNSLDNFEIKWAVEYPRAFLPIYYIANESINYQQIRDDANIAEINEIKQSTIENFKASNSIMLDTNVRGLLSKFDSETTITDPIEYANELATFIDNNLTNTIRKNNIYIDSENPSQSSIVTKVMFNTTENSIIYNRTTLEDYINDKYSRSLDIDSLNIEFDENNLSTGNFFVTSHPEIKYFFKVENGIFMEDLIKQGQLETKTPEETQVRDEELNQERIELLNEVTSLQSESPIDLTSFVSAMTNILTGNDLSPELFAAVSNLETILYNAAESDSSLESLYEKFIDLQERIDNLDIADNNNKGICKI